MIITGLLHTLKLKESRISLLKFMNATLDGDGWITVEPANSLVTIELKSLRFGIVGSNTDWKNCFGVKQLVHFQIFQCSIKTPLLP